LLCGARHAAAVPLLAAAFISSHTARLVALLIASTVALLAFGVTGAWLGGAKKGQAALRVVIGGWLAMGITYGIGRLTGSGGAA
jgi:vacuolar iron transporter family protein